MSATGAGSARAPGTEAPGTGAGDSGVAATGAEPAAWTVDAGFAVTPPPPYVAVIFTSRLTDHPEGYDRVAARLATLAREQPGFLGVESARGTDGVGITVSYWRDEASAAAWRAHPEHVLGQDQGRREWYARYAVRVAHVVRARDITAGRSEDTVGW